MKYQFEIYLLGQAVRAEQWTTLYKAFSAYCGLLSQFTIFVRFNDNVVRFFVASDKDLGSLSNNLDGVILRPVDEKEVAEPRSTSKERFVNFVDGGNLLDLKEKYAVKKSKQLEFAALKVRTLNTQKAMVRTELFFQDGAKQFSKSSKLLPFFPANLLAADFVNNPRYMKKEIAKYLNIEKSLHMLQTANVDALFEVNTFPFSAHNYYLGIADYEFDKHSFIIGASGSGKSKFISLFVDRLLRTQMKMNYRVIVIDPHASLAEDFQHIPNHKVINFNKDEGTELFAGAGADITAAVELTATLFKSLLGDQFNSRLDRLLRFTLFVLFTAQNMSLDTMKRFLTDIELRNQVLEHVGGYVPANIVRFFGSDFNEIRTKYYNEAIQPIVALVDEMQLQPSLVNEGDVSLAKTVQDNFLTVFSLNKVSMGEKVVKTVSGLLIQQIFLLAQSRVFQQRVLLIIDEVSVVQNPALASILAEARKFNLSVMLTQQYFGQIEKDLQDAIFANVYNYYAFKVSEEDARALEGNLNMELPKEITEEEHAKGVKERDVRVKMMTELHPRECLVRVMSGGQMAPCIKARTMDVPVVSAAKHDQADLREYKQAQVATPKLPDKFVESDNAVAPKALSDSAAQSSASKSVENSSQNVDFSEFRGSGELLSPEFDPAMKQLSQPQQEPESSRQAYASRFGHFVVSSWPGEALSNDRGYSLRELLAEHSSSRETVNNRKAAS